MANGCDSARQRPRNPDRARQIRGTKINNDEHQKREEETQTPILDPKGKRCGVFDPPRFGGCCIRQVCLIASLFDRGFVRKHGQLSETPKLVAIVDDDELIRGALHGLMKEAGFPALAFASAEEFLNSGQQEHTACLIADIRMPGMSGLDLQSRLNERQYRIPIIFITAQGDEKMRMQALRAGAVEFLTKPFDDEVLLDSVRAALDS